MKYRSFAVQNVKETVTERLKMQRADDDAIFEQQQEDEIFLEQTDGHSPGESVEEVQASKEIEEIQASKEIEAFDTSGEHEEAEKNIVVFLRAKGLSNDLVKTLINTDLTDEYVRLLRALEFNDDDIGNLRDLWQAKNHVSKSSDSTDPSTSDGSSLQDAHFSQNSLYLKNVLGKPLTEALREIVATKPADPVEYLGHWLLHFKVCEERSIHKKEEELELLIKREKLRMEKIEDKEPFLTELKEEDQASEDWDYLHYGESQIDNVSDL